MLFQKIKLELFGVCDVVMDNARTTDGSTYLIDADNDKYAAIPGIKMRRFFKYGSTMNAFSFVRTRETSFRWLWKSFQG